MTDPAKTLDFQILETQSEVKGEVPNTYWKMVGYHFKKRKLAVFGLWVTIFLFFVAIFATLLANDKPILFYHQGKRLFSCLFRRGQDRLLCLEGPEEKKSLHLPARYRKRRGDSHMAPGEVFTDRIQPAGIPRSPRRQALVRDR